jgi:hypothetical protein
MKVQQIALIHTWSTVLPYISASLDSQCMQSVVRSGGSAVLQCMHFTVFCAKRMIPPIEAVGVVS